VTLKNMDYGKTVGAKSRLVRAVVASVKTIVSQFHLRTNRMCHPLLSLKTFSKPGNASLEFVGSRHKGVGQDWTSSALAEAARRAHVPEPRRCQAHAHRLTSGPHAGIESTPLAGSRALVGKRARSATQALFIPIRHRWEGIGKNMNAFNLL
jgi:hypothetical protein